MDTSSRAAFHAFFTTSASSGASERGQHTRAVVVPEDRRRCTRVPIAHAASLLLEIDAAPVRRHDAIELRARGVLGQHHKSASVAGVATRVIARTFE